MYEKNFRVVLRYMSFLSFQKLHTYGSDIRQNQFTSEINK
jgi:hypothetical protein